ncbi:MAG: hypothetical protein NT062_02130 [Proteobacteria bacterium]|nr:hypothetical protein [Pseudomonadota bacterium]
MSHLPKLLLATLAACHPALVAQTAAPPGRTARLDAVEGTFTTKHYRLELTQGVAFAFTCMASGPCEKVTVTSEDPAIAEPRVAALTRLVPNRGGAYGADDWQNRAPAAATVIVGRAVGTTRVHLHSADGGRMIVVTVVAPPATAPSR